MECRWHIQTHLRSLWPNFFLINKDIPDYLNSLSDKCTNVSMIKFMQNLNFEKQIIIKENYTKPKKDKAPLAIWLA